MPRPRLFLAACAVATASCTLGPDYERPEVPVPGSWREIATPESLSLADLPWWELFQDQALQELINIALCENKDLLIAVERIEEARARYGFVKSEFWPKIDAFASAGRVQPTEEGNPAAPGIDDEALYQLGASAFWELDVFGRITRASEAELALLLASEEARRAVVITLVADVAAAYIELRDFDRRLEISRGTLESRREYVELARVRFEGGLTSEIDQRQAEAEFYRTQSFVQEFERLVMRKENELCVLLGRNPGDIPRGALLQEIAAPPAVPAGLPSALLERRPDVRQAEEILVAVNAGIGEAKALLYPRIALTGDFGWQSTELDGLFTAPAVSWSIAANLLQPIFNAGENKSRVEIAESQQRQALYAYELAILLAFREVEDSLVDFRKFGEERASEGERVAAERKVLELAELRYRGGVSDYLEVLDAQRSLFSAELDEVQAIASQLTGLIRLYRALGGGWTSAGEPTPEQQDPPS